MYAKMQECLTTIDERSPDKMWLKPCVFPFTYNNRTRHGCIRDTKDGLDDHWCSTKTVNSPGWFEINCVF